MKLEKLLERMDYKVLAGSTDIEISTLVYDSRKVEKASVFVCISGAVSDAHDFIPDVVKKGAAAVVVEKDVTPIEAVSYTHLHLRDHSSTSHSLSSQAHVQDVLRHLTLDLLHSSSVSRCTSLTQQDVLLSGVTRQLHHHTQ